MTFKEVQRALVGDYEVRVNGYSYIRRFLEEYTGSKYLENPEWEEFEKTVAATGEALYFVEDELVINLRMTDYNRLTDLEIDRFFAKDDKIFFYVHII